MNDTIKLADLNPEQLATLQRQMREAAKADRAKVKDRWAVVDPMLQERDGAEFKHTTADILVALQAAKLAPATLEKEERAEWLKKIQTRKQVMEKEEGQAGLWGYKASGGFRALTADTVVDWLLDDENLAKLTQADRNALIKQLSK